MHRQISTREGGELVKLKANVDTRTCRYKLVMNKFQREMRWKRLSARAETQVSAGESSQPGCSCAGVWL